MPYERNFDLLKNNFRKVFFPTLLSAIAGNFAILVDAFLISLFIGSHNLAVVQSIEPLASFSNVLYWLIGLGGSIICTKVKAGFDDEKSNRLFTVGLMSISLIGLLITLSCFLFPDSYLKILSPNTLKPLVSQYFYLYAPGIFFTCYMASLAYFVKIDGFIDLQFRAFLMSNVLNIILDVVFLKFLNLGVGGAGLATTLGAAAASIYLTSYFFSPKRTLKLVKVESSKIIGSLIEICKSGLSAASIPFYQTIKLLVLNGLVMGIFGNIGLSAFNMCYNAMFLVNIFIYGTAQSILPIISVYYKESDYTGVDYVSKLSLKIGMVFAIFFTALFTIFPQIILFIFNVNHPAHVAFMMNVVRIFSISFLAFAVNNLYIFYAESTDLSKLANTIAMLQGLVFPIVFAYLFTGLLGGDGFWISLVVSEFATLLFIFIYSKYKTYKSHEYSEFLLNRQNDDESVFEYTITGKVENIVDVSRQVSEFIADDRLSAIVGMAMEDMAVYVLDINGEIDLLDIIIRDKTDFMLISIKYSGETIDLTKNTGPYSNLSILKNISQNIEYSQILGLNNIVITLK